jgi:TorA maturation chaperone TorD
MRHGTALLIGIVLSIAAGGPTLAGVPLLAATYSQDAAIQSAFRAVLNRDPSASELRRYRVLMDENGWTEADVRRDLGERADYRRYSGGRGVSPTGIVRRAYQDILGRDPDAQGLRDYRNKIVTEGWSEQDVREALRRSDEYASTGTTRTASADRIIRRAYRDVLHREPDPSGLATYRRNIIENGWDEHDVRLALRKSPEKGQQRLGLTDAQATEIVRRAYLAVLNREPDETGMRDYKARVLSDRWTEQQVAQALRNSDEYRSKHP